MGFELVELDERAAVEQKLDPFARGHPPVLALLFEPLLAAAAFGLARESIHPLDVFFKPHASNYPI